MDEIESNDSDDYEYKQDKLTFRDLMFRHLMKISEISTKEFRAGFWQNKPVKTATGTSMQAVYSPDTRDEYINAVNFLHDILLPHFDKDIKKNEVDKDIKKDKLLINTRKLFQDLSILLKRLNYLAAHTSTE